MLKTTSSALLSDLALCDGFSIVERPLTAFVQVAAYSGRGNLLKGLLQDTANEALDEGKGYGDDEVRLLWSGPDAWTYASGVLPPQQIMTLIADLVPSDQAAIFDLSNARTCLRVSGHRRFDIFNKSCQVDFSLHKTGDVIMTTMEQCAVLLHLVRDDATDVYVMRTLAEALNEALKHSVAEFR